MLHANFMYGLVTDVEGASKWMVELESCCDEEPEDVRVWVLAALEVLPVD